MRFCKRKARMNFGCMQDSALKPFQPRENKRILQLLIVDFGGDEFGGGADNAQP